MDQYPVTYEPDQNMNHVETYGVHPEEDVGSQRRQGPRQHALRQGLQQDGVWDHRRPQLDPSENILRFLVSLRKITIVNLTIAGKNAAGKLIFQTFSEKFTIYL